MGNCPQSSPFVGTVRLPAGGVNGTHTLPLRRRQHRLAIAPGPQNSLYTYCADLHFAANALTPRFATCDLLYFPALLRFSWPVGETLRLGRNGTKKETTWRSLSHPRVLHATSPGLHLSACKILSWAKDLFFCPLSFKAQSLPHRSPRQEQSSTEQCTARHGLRSSAAQLALQQPPGIAFE